MAVTLADVRNVTNEWTPVYAHNLFRLTGALAGEKYVLQVWSYDEDTSTYGTKLADVRQSRNPNGDAIFDLQNILQSYVGNDHSIESTSKYQTSEQQTFIVGLKVGVELTNGDFREDSAQAPFELVPTRLEYYQTIANPKANHIPTISGDPESAFNCSVVTEMADMLTDMPTYAADTFEGGKPSYIDDADEVYNVKLTSSDYFTVSWLNRTEYGIDAPDSNVKGVEAWFIHYYNGNSLINSEFEYNTLSNGGGPNASIGDGTAITFPYAFETFQLSDNNPGLNIPANTTHYWAYPVVYTPGNCGPGNYMLEPAYNPVRVEVYEPQCLDYEHIQVSWQNSYGFRDYYTFTKRNEKRITANRNTYFQSAVDYNSTSLDIATSNRGEKTFSQQLDNIYTASTDFMADETAEWLENLYRSADTRVRFGDSGEWFPVTLTSNTYTKQTYRKDGLFQYEIQFKLAHPLKTQRG